MSLVVDASVAVEYLLRTQLGEQVEPMLETSDLCAPELVDVEVMAVLRKEVLSGRLSARRAAEAIDDLRQWDLERIEHRALLTQAWSLHGRVSAYDAFYVAAARLRHATLVSADGPLTRAPALGITVHNVRMG